MRVTPKTFLAISLAAHVAAGMAIYGRRAPASPAGMSEPIREPEALFSGDTFEVPEEVLGEVPEVPSPDLAPRSEEETPATPRARSTTRRISNAPADRGPARTGGGESGAGSTFGATSDRASIDLATAFTRGFPQAASADPAWLAAPFGPAGQATVVLEIDETGSLVSSHVEGNPSPALRAGIERTFALLRARAFTAGRPVTRLHVSATVSPDEVHDGLHGEVFAIGGSFDRAEGSAFFALAIGRRIDLRVRE